MTALFPDHSAPAVTPYRRASQFYTCQWCGIERPWNSRRTSRVCQDCQGYEQFAATKEAL